MASKKLVARHNVPFSTSENTRLKVFREIWNVGNGKEKTYFKYSLPDSVQIFALTENNSVITISEFQPGVGKDYLHLPGETMEKGETPEETAVRGLMEETGYRTEKIELLSSILENSGWSDRLIHYVLLTGCTKVGNGESEIETRLIEPVEFWSLLMNYFLDSSQNKHGGANTLKGTALALQHLGLLKCESK